uniref:Uncharacterized protein n=1 Tax=viral metagenome TaxID=1070528 RepID=A0A6C0BL14_9ZZZZ
MEHIRVSTPFRKDTVNRFILECDKVTMKMLRYKPNCNI